MRTLRQIFSVIVLTLVLSMSTLAGEMDTGIAPQPTPAPATMDGQIEIPHQAAGEITTGVPADPVVEGALSLLRIVLTLV